MSRRRRIEYKGAIYHVIQRGNDRKFIFDKDEDKEFLLNDIFEKKNDMGVKLIGYVIMSNHFHLLLQTMDKPLSIFMHRINNKFSKHYNHQNGKTGHVYEERYKAIPVQNESYLLALIRYIHQNPQRAGMCKDIQDYKWSSDYNYRNNIPKHVDIDIVLNTISIDRNVAIRQYISHMEEKEKCNYSEFKKIGHESFDLIVEPKQNQSVYERKRLDEILIATGPSLEEYKHIKEGSRKRSLSHYKKAYVKKALEQNYTFKEIGHNIHISDTAAYKLSIS